MYTEPRLTRSRARAQGIDSFEDLSRTTVKARQTSKKTVGRPAFANVTNTAKETDNEQSLVKNLSADFSPAKAVGNPPSAQAVTADEAYEECAASNPVSEQEVIGGPDINTKDLLPPTSHEERAAGQCDTILQTDAVYQAETLATIPNSAEDYIALDASEAGSLEDSAPHSNVDIPVHVSVLNEAGETDSMHGITDDNEAATLTPMSAVNQVLTSPLPARSSTDSRSKQSATGGNDSHLGETVEASPTLVLHDFNNGVVPMSVMMDSMFKQGTSAAVEQLQNLQMPECDSPMQYDHPAEAVVHDQTEMHNSEYTPAKPEGFAPAQDAVDTSASSATPVVHKVSAYATAHKSPTAVPEEPATAVTPVHPAQSAARVPEPAVVLSAGAAATAIPVSPQMSAAGAAAIPVSPQVSAVARTHVPNGIAATDASENRTAAGSPMTAQEAATADTFLLPQVSPVVLSPMPSGISAPANTPVPSRHSQPARTPMSSGFLTTAYTPSRLSVSANAATVPLEFSASATPPVPAEESVAAVTPRLNDMPVTKSTHGLLETPAAAAAVTPQVPREQALTAAAPAQSVGAATPAQSMAAATPAQHVGAATSAQSVSASKPAQFMTEAQPAQAVAAATPESLTLTEQMEAGDDTNAHHGQGLPLPAGSPAPLLQAMSAYAGATPFPSASLTPSTATPLQQHSVRPFPPDTAGDNMDMKLDASNSAPAAFTPRFVACSAPDVDTSTPGLGGSRSAAKDSAMLLDSPYKASDSELSFDVGPSPPVSSQQLDHLAEQEAMNTDDRWQMEASTSNSPISYISGPVANRLGSKVHASPSYDSRSLNQLRKDLAHKLTARQSKVPVPAGLDQEQTGYDASPTSTAPGITLSPRDGDELCSALKSLGIQSTGKSREPLRGLPVPQGTHIRFDDEDGHAVPSPANTQVRLRGVPVPRNTHIRFE